MLRGLVNYRNLQDFTGVVRIRTGLNFSGQISEFQASNDLKTFQLKAKKFLVDLSPRSDGAL